ncbi:MAG TPA: hypothetical protein VEW66_07390 [Thermomicrobiales bacterium]|nr:hypothetical protein [Thermomicrobiales bacterium]
MSKRSGNDHIEFIRLNGTAVRVTSWTEIDPGQFRLVAIVRGSGDARALSEVLSADHLDLDVPGQGSQPVTIAALDRRETGAPPAVITRFAVDFVPASESSPSPIPRTIDERVGDLEREMAALRTLVAAIANDR